MVGMCKICISKINDLYPSFDLFNLYKLLLFTGKLRGQNIPLFLKLLKPLSLLDKIKCYLKLLSEMVVITFNLWKRKQRSRIGIWMKCSNESPKLFIELPPSTASSLYDGSEIGWEQKKTLGNLIYFHHFYYPHRTTALQSIHLPHHLSRSRSIFLSITYLLEISIKMSQRYFRLSHPNLFPSVLYKITGTT